MAQMKEIVHYISAELLAPEAANKLLDKMRDAIAALSFMPKKYALIEEAQNALTLPFVFITSSAKAIPIKNEKTDATIPVFNVIQSGAKSIVPIIHLP